jgi:phage FluMu protein Com
MSTVRRANGHKVTAKCPKCKYTSRIPLKENWVLTNKNSVHSKTCPTHRLPLVKLDNAS